MIKYLLADSEDRTDILDDILRSCVNRTINTTKKCSETGRSETEKEDSEDGDNTG